MKKTLEFLAYVIDPRQVGTLVLILLGFVLAYIVGGRQQLGRDEERYEAELADIHAAYDAQIEQLTAEAEAGVYATQYMPQEHIGEAWPLAQWLDCLDKLYPGLTAEAKTLACWVVINRVDSAAYPDDIESVLLQAGQFCEYSGDTPPTEANVTIASNQLARYYNGDIRPTPAGAVYITISGEGVVLRDTWEETAQTGHWRA